MNCYSYLVFYKDIGYEYEGELEGSVLSLGIFSPRKLALEDDWFRLGMLVRDSDLDMNYLSERNVPDYIDELIIEDVRRKKNLKRNRSPREDFSVVDYKGYRNCLGKRQESEFEDNLYFLKIADIGEVERTREGGRELIEKNMRIELPPIIEVFKFKNAEDESNELIMKIWELLRQ